MKIIEFDSHKVALTPISEGSTEALTQTDIAYIATLSSPARRAEQRVWRSALRSLIGKEAEIEYLPSGAPRLTGCDWQIGVSHNTEWAAVAIGKARCGIDIELLSRNFERVAARYISQEEEQLHDSTHPLFKPLLWSAKEAIYKYVASEGVDFLRDIQVTALDMDAQKLSAVFRGEPLPKIEFRLVGGSSLLCLICEKQ